MLSANFGSLKIVLVCQFGQRAIVDSFCRKIGVAPGAPTKAYKLYDMNIWWYNKINGTNDFIVWKTNETNMKKVLEAFESRNTMIKKSSTSWNSSTVFFYSFLSL